MSELTIKEFEQEYFRLYSEGAHAQAYELVTREAGRFPEWAQGSYYNWRMCAALPASWSCTPTWDTIFHPSSNAA